MTTPIALSAVQQLDDSDPLREWREHFYIPDDLIYLDGNSLGPAPKAVFSDIEKTLKQEWAEGLITSWNNAGWFMLTDTLGDQLAALLGAEAGEVVVCDTVSVNLYKTMYAALSLRPGRSVIVTEAGGFPTDLYMTEGVAMSRSDIEIRLQGKDKDADTVEELLDDSVAVALLNHVDYRSGAIRDMQALTAKAQQAGALVIWDLCHSAGVLPIELKACNADFAVGCTYKYLNGGPGAPAFIFAAKRHHGQFTQPLSGWWGHASPFAFEPSYRGDPGIRQFLCGTQPVLSLRAMQAGVNIYSQVDMQQVRQKSMALTDLFIQLVEQECTGFAVGIFSPREAQQRGSQVALEHDHGYAIVQALIERRVIGDFRMPNIMRFGFAPLYIRYADVWAAVAHLKEVLVTEQWRQERFNRRAVVT